MTGNFALCTAAVMEGRARLSGLLRSWLVTYSGNFIGAVLLAFLTSIVAAPVAEGAAAIAVAKCSATWAATFCRGLLCNWLVCMAVWMATSANDNDIASKAIGVWFPISGFAAMGFDHSVANMFQIPLGMLLGAKVSVADFIFKNLIPVTLGNVVGGALCVAMLYNTAYGKHGSLANVDQPSDRRPAAASRGRGRWYWADGVRTSYEPNPSPETPVNEHGLVPGNAGYTRPWAAA